MFVFLVLSIVLATVHFLIAICYMVLHYAGICDRAPGCPADAFVLLTNEELKAARYLDAEFYAFNWVLYAGCLAFIAFTIWRAYRLGWRSWWAELAIALVRDTHDKTEGYRREAATFARLCVWIAALPNVINPPPAPSPAQAQTGDALTECDEK